MTKAEIEAALKAAFDECNAADCPLSEQQKQILLQVAGKLSVAQGDLSHAATKNSVSTNPLDELTAEERQALLEFVRKQETLNQSWKIKLLNDWLNNTDSGSVQFIRLRYGIQWLNRVKPLHLAEYSHIAEDEVLKLRAHFLDADSWLNESPCLELFPGLSRGHSLPKRYFPSF